MIKIRKYKSWFQMFSYTKFFRSARWLFRRIMYKRLDAQKRYVVPMRIGHQMIIRPTQRYLENVIYSRQYHDQNVFLLNSFLAKDSVVLDIGANIGLYSCAYAHYFKDINVKIFAIEAVKSNAKLLKENIALNNLTNVQVDHLALGKECGELTFELPSQDFIGNAVGSNVFSHSEGSFFKEKVKMVTLDSYALENKIDRCDFIKIDVEGAEYLVFSGAKNFLANCRPVIEAEFNSFWLKQVNVDFQDFVSLFAPLDYVFAVDRGNYIEIINDIEQFRTVHELFDLFFIPRERLGKLL